MAYYTEAEARSAARATPPGGGLTASGYLTKSAGAVPARETYDIFLCHSFRDAELVLGAKRLLEGDGRSVYVDWVDDALVDRGAVTAATADLLRRRMRACRSLVYASSPAAVTSKWMPWELGHFDGLRGGENVAVMPLVRVPGEPYARQEYPSLYDRVERLTRRSGRDAPFVTRRDAGGVRWMPLSGLAMEHKSFRPLG